MELFFSNVDLTSTKGVKLYGDSLPVDLSVQYNDPNQTWLTTRFYKGSYNIVKNSNK